MRKYLLLITALISFHSLSQQLSYQEMLIGTWMESSLIEGTFFYQESTYLIDGRKCTFAIEKHANGRIETSYFKTTWFVDLTNKITAEVELSSSEFVPKGQKFVDKIKELTKEKLVIAMIEPLNDPDETYYKLPYDRGESICSMVEQNT